MDGIHLLRSDWKMKNRIEKCKVEDIALDFAYFQHLESTNSWEFLSFIVRDLWDFTNHNMSALKEGGA